MAHILILAGGRSSRMGSDKTRLLFRGKTLLDAAVNRFGERFDSVYISFGAAGGQPDTACPVLRDIHAGLGPISGLHAGLTLLGDVFLVAADMPFSDPGEAARLIALADGFDAVAAERGGRAEPLFAFYKKSLLPRVEEAIITGDYSLHRLLRSANTRFAEVAGRTLMNVNTPADYEALLSES